MVDEVKDSKKKTNGKTLVHIVIGVLIGIVLFAVVLFVLYSNNVINITSTNVKHSEVKENNKQDENTDFEEENGEEDNSDSIDSYTLNFDPTKVINSTGGTYSLVVPSPGKGTNISIDVNQMKATIAINYTLVNQTYSLGWVTAAESYIYEPREVSFDKKIVDVFFGGFGQDASGDTILFLMEDGTVQYIPLKKALITNSDVFNSYGTIPGVTQIVKFYEANTTGGVTVLAQRADGSFYDLAPILRETGNY